MISTMIVITIVILFVITIKNGPPQLSYITDVGYNFYRSGGCHLEGKIVIHDKILECGVLI